MLVPLPNWAIRLARRKHAVLSSRLVLTTFLYSFVIALFTSALLLYLSYQQSVRDAQQTYREIAASHLPGLTASLWDVDHVRTELLLDGIAELPHVGFVLLVDETGAVSKRGQVDKDRELSQQQFQLTHPDYSMALATLTIGLSNSELLQQLRERALGIGVSTLLALSLGALCVLLLFRTMVARHLSQMSAYAESLDLQHLDQPLSLDRERNQQGDELDQVADSLNRMRTTLLDDLAIRSRIETELAEHRDHLETLVAARTAELAAQAAVLEQQAQELASQNQELDAYAHTVAHDLKTPLTTIRGLSALLKHAMATFTPAQANDAISTISQTSIKMTRIIDEMLGFASLRHTGNQPPEPLDMAALTAEAAQRLATHAAERNASITFHTPMPVALGVPQWIEEVWVNYLSNAIKYGGLSPQIDVGASRQADGMIKCWVRDQGPGISAEQQPELFLAHRRFSPAAAEGHGLGLSIVKRIVNRLGGEVGYERTDTGASCFWFTLPAAPTETAPEQRSQ